MVNIRAKIAVRQTVDGMAESAPFLDLNREFSGHYSLDQAWCRMRFWAENDVLRGFYLNFLLKNLC
jgi:hypothetical protein